MTKSKKGKGAKTASQPNSATEANPEHATISPSAPPGRPSTSAPTKEEPGTAPGGPTLRSPSAFLPSFNAFQAMPPESTTANWMKVQTLDDDLKVFLQPNITKSSKGITSLKLYRILVHFNPKTSSRPSNLKDLLWSKYVTDVAPLLKPHILPEPAASMETKSSSHDFDPLSRKTTRKQLTEAVHSVNRQFVIPSNSPRDCLLVLYKVFVDKDLFLPWLTDFIKSPKVVQPERVHTLSMEELRMTLQEQAPHVFIHLGPMTLSVLINLYIKFVCDEPVGDDVLVKGFHYSLFRQHEE